MKPTVLPAALWLATLFLWVPGCGDPAIGTLQSITLTSTTGSFQLKGEGGTIQLIATGNYTSRATRDLTNKVVYTATPLGTTEDGSELPNFSMIDPQTISISATGLVTAVVPFVCTYSNSGTTASPVWTMTGSYEIVATLSGVSSQPVYVGVASAPGTGPNDGHQCGP